MKTQAALSVLLLALGAIASANVKTGDRIPGFQAEFLQSDAKSLEDFSGRVLMIDFFRTDSEPSSAEVEGLNQLEERHAARGFAVVGVTNEPKKLVVESLARTPRKHAIALVKGNKVDQLYGVISIPHLLLVDVDGRVVWTGALSELDTKELEGLFAVVVPPISPKNPDAYKAMRRGQYDVAYEAIRRGLGFTPDDAELASAKTSIESALAARLAQAKAALEAKKHGDAWSRYGRITAAFGLMPAAAEAKEAQVAIEKDPAAKDDLAAWKLHERAEAKAFAGDDEKAVAEWEALVKRYPETATAARAKIALRQRGR
jgi:tetratricopeptide (TPR) repeat protein